MRRLKRKILRGTAAGVAMAAAIGTCALIGSTSPVDIMADELESTAAETTDNSDTFDEADLSALDESTASDENKTDTNTSETLNNSLKATDSEQDISNTVADEDNVNENHQDADVKKTKNNTEENLVSQKDSNLVTKVAQDENNVKAAVSSDEYIKAVKFDKDTVWPGNKVKVLVELPDSDKVYTTLGNISESGKEFINYIDITLKTKTDDDSFTGHVHLEPIDGKNLEGEFTVSDLWLNGTYTVDDIEVAVSGFGLVYWPEIDISSIAISSFNLKNSAQNHVNAISFDKSEVEAGNSVKVTAQSDSKKGIAYIALNLYKTAQSSLTYLLYHDGENTYSREIEIDDTWSNGKHEIEDYYAFDADGIRCYWDDTKLSDFSVINSKEEKTYKEADIELTFDKLTAVPGEKVVIRAAGNDIDDVNELSVYLQNEETYFIGYPNLIKLYKQNDGTLKGEFTVTTATPNGKYHVDYVRGTSSKGIPIGLYNKIKSQELLIEKSEGKMLAPKIVSVNFDKNYVSFDENILNVNVTTENDQVVDYIEVSIGNDYMGNYKTVKLLPDPSGGFSGAFTYTEDEIEYYIRAGGYAGSVAGSSDEEAIIIAVYDKNNNKYQAWLADYAEQGIKIPINANYDRIEFRVLADYTKVESAISSIPQDLTIYTDESVKKLNKTVGEVIEYRSSKEQKIVDGYADNIKAAIDALELKKVNDSQTSISYSNTEGNGAVYAAQSGTPLEFVFKRSVDDDKTFAHFTGVNVDGKGLTASDYKASEGSVNVELQPGFLATLAVGEHDLTALFDDGNDVNVKFTITEGEKKEEPAKQSENITEEPIDSVSGSEKNSNEENSLKEKEQNLASQPVTVSYNQGVQNMKREAAVSKTAASTAVKPDLSNPSAAATTTPETGDKNHTPIWMAAAGAAAVAAVALAGVVVRRKKKTEK